MKNYPKLNIGVGGLIFRNKKEILLIKRKANHSVWTIPSGYMEDSEDLFQTITREAKEEVNVSIMPKGIIGIRQRLIKKEGNNLWIIVMADYKSGKIMPDNSEISKAQFMAIPEALKEKITPVTKQIIRLLINKKLQIFLPQKNPNKKNYKFFA